MEQQNNNTAVAEIYESTDFMLGLNELKNRALMVTEIKRQIMKEGTHFGKIPGCGDKPTLLKNGAELLCMAFKLAPEAKVEISDLGNGHREYTVTTTLVSIVNGTTIATGLGSCSTLESKYRYRGTELVPTGKPVPQNYWKTKDAALLGGKGFVAKKDEDGSWKIFRKGDKKTENPDLADQYNTVLKMASKRSLVDATLKATGGSCEFTQDLEDMAENAIEDLGPRVAANDYADYQVMDEAPAPQQTKAPAKKPATKTKALSEEEKAANFAKSMDALIKQNEMVAADAFTAFGYDSYEDVPADRRQEVYFAVAKAVKEADNG